MRKQSIGFDPHTGRKAFKLRFSQSELPQTQFFNPEDVFVGNPSSNIAVAAVYIWKEDRPPEKIRQFLQRISNYAYLTGYWKTTNGARYVFANLLANPNVNKLVLLVFAARDNGHLLADAVVSFWRNGLDRQGIIKGTRAPNPRFEQVSSEAAERLRLQMDLVVMREITDLDRAESLLKCLYQEPQNACEVPAGAEFHSIAGQKLLYDCGARFDKPFRLDLRETAREVHYIQKYSRLPLGQTVHAKNLRDALEMVTAFVYKKGAMFRDQRGVITMESRSFSVTIRDVLEVIPHGYSEQYIRKYVAEFMEGAGGSLDEFAYTYHERIFRRWGNQVERAVSVLKKNPDTRRCLISLWDPAEDLEKGSPPCLDLIWLVVRDSRLEMHVIYRSHHLSTITKDGKLMEGEGAFVPNLYALGTLQKHISEKAGVSRGPLVLTDFSAHLYMSGV